MSVSSSLITAMWSRSAQAPAQSAVVLRPRQLVCTAAAVNMSQSDIRMRTFCQGDAGRDDQRERHDDNGGA